MELGDGRGGSAAGRGKGGRGMIRSVGRSVLAFAVVVL